PTFLEPRTLGCRCHRVQCGTYSQAVETWRTESCDLQVYSERLHRRALCARTDELPGLRANAFATSTSLANRSRLRRHQRLFTDHAGLFARRKGTARHDQMEMRNFFLYLARMGT